MIADWLPSTLVTAHSGLLFMVLGPVPLFLPGVILSAIVGLGAARPLARWLHSSSAVAWLLVFSVGTIVSLTLTPVADAIGGGAVSGGTCDLRRLGPAPLGTLVRVNEVSLNVLLFVPLGLALGLLPRSDRTAVLIAAAFGLPLLVEGTQLLVVNLGRSCQSADVMDNLTGLMIGLAIGVGLAQIRALRSRRPGGVSEAGRPD